MDKESQREKNRREMPNVAAMMDEMRDLFGNDIKLIWARDEETGKEVGRKPEYTRVFPVPPNYAPSTTFNPKGKRK